MQISLVQNKPDLKAFIDLPYHLYQQDPLWVPPLRNEIQAQFDPVRNPLLDHCEYALFLLLDNGQVIGRIAAFIDHLAVKAWKEPIGLFGYYESPPEMDASIMLLDAARNWLVKKGMKAMRGPWSFVSQEWGAVVEGYTPPPVVMAPYNPPYYDHQFESFGLIKAKDLLVYYIDAREGYQIPERVIQFTDRIAERYGIHVRQIDMHHFDREVERLIQLSNASLVDNWGYAPVTEAEVRAMAHDLKPIIHPRAVVFAEDEQGNPIGFAIALPDINIILKKINARILPFGWVRLLWELPRLTHYRMFALGVIPEYHGKGIDSLIYRRLYETCFRPDLSMEINYVLEDNAPMNNAILKLGAKPLRRYRVYQMAL
jgi:GNAT superfamily N-acetyltransferase